MDEFDLLSNVTFGQYLPGRSFLHRLDARAKVVAFVVIIVAMSAVLSYTGNLVALGLVFALVKVAGVPLGYALRSLRPAAPLIGLFIVFQFLFGGNFDAATSTVLWQWSAPVALGPLQPQLTVTTGSIKAGVVVAFRAVEFVVLASLLTFTTDTTTLTHAIERLLQPFQVVRVPAHELAMMVTIALRFVPTLAEETERIMKAQASRGADFGRPGAWRWVTATRNLIPILVPLFVLTFRRAEELILAMESRCYVGGKGRTRLGQLTMRATDWLALAGAAGVAALLLFVTYPA